MASPLRQEALAAMQQCFVRLEKQVPSPQIVEIAGSPVPRFENKGLREAILQKLARLISGLWAVEVLLVPGLVQEIGVLFRVLDDIRDDIAFLASPLTGGVHTDKHDQYLEAFYGDRVFHGMGTKTPIQKPNLVPQRKIRAHVANTHLTGAHRANMIAAGEDLSVAFSGHVHASSETIMETYGGNPPHFHVDGMRNTPILAGYEDLAYGHVFRGLMTTAIAAKAFGDAEAHESIYKVVDHFSAAAETQSLL